VEEFGSLHGIVHTVSLLDPPALEDTLIDCVDGGWNTHCQQTQVRRGFESLLRKRGFEPRAG